MDEEKDIKKEVRQETLTEVMAMIKEKFNDLYAHEMLKEIEKLKEKK